MPRLVKWSPPRSRHNHLVDQVIGDHPLFLFVPTVRQSLCVVRVKVTLITQWEARKEALERIPRRPLARPVYVDPAPTMQASMLMIVQKADAAAGKKAAENAKVAAEEAKEWSKGSKSNAKK
jgi:hypothetical protein